MRPPRQAQLYEYERAKTFLKLHFHHSSSGGLGVIEEDSTCTYAFRKTSLSRSMTYRASLFALANDDEHHHEASTTSEEENSFLNSSR